MARKPFAPGKDPWGFTTGGEDQDYGDFLSTVHKATLTIQELVTRDLARAQNAGNQK